MPMLTGDRQSLEFSLSQDGSSIEAHPLTKTTHLPLRLAAERGALGIEISHPITVGALCIEDLHVRLSDLSFPLDLSKGVKQFRNRSTLLSKIRFRIDLASIARALTEALRSCTGLDSTQVSIKPMRPEGPATEHEEVTNQARSRKPERPYRSAEQRNDPITSSSISGMTITLFSPDYCLSFDLVLESGRRPRFILDNARGLGLNADLQLGKPALGLSLELVDQLLAAENMSTWGLRREGRALYFDDLTRALCLELMPSLGCRLPHIEDLVLVNFEADSAELLLTLERGGDALVSSQDALLISGLANLGAEADDALAQGNYEQARSHYLQLLDDSPAHPQLLSELTDLDIEEERPLAALGWAHEVLEQSHNVATRCHHRMRLNLYRALRALGRNGSAIEVAHVILKQESDAWLRAALLVQVAEMSGHDFSRPGVSEALAEAITLAPRYEYARWLEIRNLISSGELRQVDEKVAQLLSLNNPARRSTLSLKVANHLLEHGFHKNAEKYLRELRRNEPLAFPLCFHLGSALASSGLKEEAIESLNFSLRNSKRFDSYLPKELEVVNQGRITIALLLDEVLGDASQALIHLRSVESRGLLGLQARQLEMRLEAKGEHMQTSMTQARVMGVQLRLLEALEMEWIPLESAEGVLNEILDTSETNPAVRSKATLLLRSLADYE